MDDTTASLPTIESSSPGTAYAGFAVRFRALLIDGIIMLVSVFLLVMLAFAASGSDAAVRLLLLALAAVTVLYEPVMVSRFGATVGHRRANLMVVADKTGTNPRFPRALLRYLIKATMGLPSFVTMAFTERHQAVHDRVSGTTVQIRDLSKALPGDAKWAREPLFVVGLPSRVRRAGIILAYVFLSFVVMSFIGSLAISRACVRNDSACSAGEKLFNSALGLIWFGVIAWIAIRGWQGRLVGARRRTTASIDAPAS